LQPARSLSFKISDGDDEPLEGCDSYSQLSDSDSDPNIEDSDFTQKIEKIL
jgi:hypothetical protein